MLPRVQLGLEPLRALGLRLLNDMGGLERAPRAPRWWLGAPRQSRGAPRSDVGAADPGAEDLGDLGTCELRRHQLAAPEQLTHHRAAQRHAVLRRVWAGLGRGDGLAAAAVEGLVEEEGRDP